MCSYDSFSKVDFYKQRGCYLCEKTDWLRVGLAVLDSEVKARCISCRSPSGNGKEVRRCVWRVVGVGVGLLRHDGEVEGVVVKDDAVLELCVRGRAC